MVEVREVRRIALSLDGTVEQDHHGFSSFRAGGRIYATLPDDEHVHVMLGADRIRDVVATEPHACEEKWWGKTLAAVRVSLPDADRALVAALLREARDATAARKRSKKGGP
jgi:hypothetical protein